MLLNIQGNTKDGLLNICQDIVEMGIRVQFHLRSNGKKIYLPPTCSSMPYVVKSLILSSQMSWKMRLPLYFVCWRCIFLLLSSTS